MNVVEQALSNWKNSLPQEVPLAGLISISVGADRKLTHPAD